MKFAILLLALLPLTATAADLTIPPGPDHCIIKRDVHGKIARSRTPLVAFVRAHPCPATGKHSTQCVGWVLDHARPICACGPDIPSNLQWQRVVDSKVKDKAEDKLCANLKARGWVK